MNSSPLAPTATGRLFFLDWLRILAFALLVPYHVGMYYVSWDWHVKSPNASGAIEPLMMLTSPWRLSLLFFIGGAATQALLRRQSGPGFVGQRSSRLLWPLLFGMLVIVPPQAYVQGLTQLGFVGDYGAFMQRYLQGGKLCSGTNCIDLPTWNHLWFLPYLWIYSLIAWALVRWAPKLLDAAAARLPVGPWGLLLGLALPTMAARLMYGAFPSTHNLTWDWYNHAQYLWAFGLGMVGARAGDQLWAGLQAQRWPALGLAFAGWAMLCLYFFGPWHDQNLPEGLLWAQRLLWGATQWWAIVAACGFARRWLDHDGPWRRRLTGAVFCLYVMHQTVIVLLAWWLQPLALPPVPEGLLLIVATFAASGAVYLVARHVPVLAGLLGIVRARPLPRGLPARSLA
ncbi:MAG TPA: acyltransferase family protein [Ideonella sp.]|uniref:acyltransferase family protein n=1 Tax=Ideonella sp. TaxID=1929293 RepID=UPI002B8F0086|nr:acyltransferase family protein [Ideonella sp.]HSI46687.1 acyltransferase family protein [Ideonella sp.]